jgi:hypothetical protein
MLTLKRNPMPLLKLHQPLKIATLNTMNFYQLLIIKPSLVIFLSRLKLLKLKRMTVVELQTPRM